MVNPSSRLSKRQKEILQLLAYGKNRHQIGQELYISDSTISRALTESQKRLRANSVPHTIAKAIAQKIITPPFVPSSDPTQQTVSTTGLEPVNDEANSNEHDLISFISQVMEIAPWNDLTDRVMEVFLAYGMLEKHESPSNAQIGQEVELSKESMRQYARRVKRGVGIPSDATDGRKQMMLLSRIAHSLIQLQQEFEQTKVQPKS